MRLVQWLEPKSRRRHVGMLREEQGEERAVSATSIFPKLKTTLDVLRAREIGRPRGDADRAFWDRFSRATRRPWPDLWNTPFDASSPHLLPPIDVPENPYAFTLWGAGVTHLRSAKAREEEAKAVRGRPASFYDLIYQTGLAGGKPRRLPGARPEIFYKADGHYAVGPHQPPRIARSAVRCVPEPEIVSYYAARSGRLKTHIIYGGAAVRLGYTLGNDFSDQGWESQNPLYLPHAKTQRGLAAIGPIFVTVDDALFDSREIAIRCRVFRRGAVQQDSGALRTGEKHMAHSLANLECHLFDNRPLRPAEIRGLFWGTSAVFKLPLKSGDRIEIEASSGLGALRNPVL